MNKRIISSILIISAILCSFGCNNVSIPDDENTDDILVADQNGCDYVIVRSEKAGEYGKLATSSLKEAIVTKTGSDIKAEDDWVSDSSTVEAERNDKEILIGLTNRPESEQAAELLKKANKNDNVSRYIIKEINGHITMLGDTEYGTYLASRYFADTFVSSSVKLKKEYEYIGTYYAGDDETMIDIERSGLTFFRPEGGRVGDVIPIYHNGIYYIFYLSATDGKWAYVMTKDFVNYSSVKILSDFGGTGDLIYADGLWHLFASKVSGNEEIIHHYCGEDIDNLKDIKCDHRRGYDTDKTRQK